MKVYEVDLEVKTIRTIRVTVASHENHLTAVNKAIDIARESAAVVDVLWTNYNLVKEYIDE